MHDTLTLAVNLCYAYSWGSRGPC